MLLDFNTILNKHNLKINGILHIGAHYGEEHNIYLKNGIEKIIYFEPDPDTFKKLNQKIKKSKDIILHNIGLGNIKGTIDFNIALNNGASSSILKPKKHLQRHPNVKFSGVKKININKLDNINFNRSEYNLINIDVQGYELEVFKGGVNTLKSIDYIITEVNRDEVYENCVKIGELDDFLSHYKFKRVETTWDGGIWGDALYLKNK